jgi:hypothetical protein
MNTAIILAIEFLVSLMFKSKAWGKFQAAVHIAEQNTDMTGKEKFAFAFDKFKEFLVDEAFEMCDMAVHSGVQLAAVKMNLESGRRVFSK